VHDEGAQWAPYKAGETRVLQYFSSFAGGPKAHE
jgi:hypothetical protein